MSAQVVGKVNGRDVAIVNGKLVYVDTGARIESDGIESGREDPFAPVGAPPAQLEDDDRLGGTDRVTPAGVESKGTNMGRMSLERANELTGGYQMGNLANYFGTRPASPVQTGNSVSDLETAGGARSNGGNGTTVAEAVAQGQSINPAAPGKNTAYDTMDQSRQIGMPALSPQMSRQAMFNFLDSEGSVMQQLAARDAGLGLLRQGGQYFANINGEMQPISKKQYDSVVRRDSTAIGGVIQEFDDEFRMPGDNAPPQTSSPFASSIQQPLFSDTRQVPEAVAGATQRAFAAGADSVVDFYPGVFEAAVKTMPGYAEDFYRANQMPIDNITDELYEF